MGVIDTQVTTILIAFNSYAISVGTTHIGHIAGIGKRDKVAAKVVDKVEVDIRHPNLREL